MKTRAIFLSSTHEAGRYWAIQWGYRKSEVLIVSPTQQERIMGLRPDPDVPCFICGPTVFDNDRDRLEEIVEHLQMRGFTILDAQEMGGEYREVLG